ncbi:hypothetical protein [Streptomyces siamensis]|uniref:Uncharacterized protein n=1 Tax=Streptomyces siamensis TaxID=1274986 RepID=A0ABP9JPV0_9ACTN
MEPDHTGNTYISDQAGSHGELPIKVPMIPARERSGGSAPAQLGTAGPLGKLPVGGTPLLLRLGKVVGERSHAKFKHAFDFLGHQWARYATP